MPRQRVLITVKTYPTLSRKYGELVCTAGLREDGSWIRLYPVPFRKLDYTGRYKKYQWINAEIERNTSDFRPESHKVLNPDTIELGEVIPTGGVHWKDRRDICLRHVKESVTELIKEAYNPTLHTSLATYKPKELIDFKIEKSESLDYAKKIQREELKSRQGNLFTSLAEDEKLADPEWYKPVEHIPYKFSYQFLDEDGTKRKLMIEDWEIFELYRNCLQREGNPDDALLKVKQKYWDEFSTKDLYFFLGTTLEFHRRKAKNPFIIVGVFYPKHPA